jgi:hypothetical protein
MYKNLVSKMDFSAFKKATYLDPETRRVLYSTWNLNNTLTSNLIAENKKAQANKLTDKYMRELPLHNYSITDTLSRLYTVQNLYALNRIKEANALAAETSAFVAQEFDYLSALEPEYQQAYHQDVQMGLSVMNNLAQITAAYKQQRIAQEVKVSCNRMLNQFGLKS